MYYQVALLSETAEESNPSAAGGTGAQLQSRRAECSLGGEQEGVEGVVLLFGICRLEVRLKPPNP